MSTAVDPYLTDASGFTGWAERILVPASEAELVDIVRAAGASRTPVTIIGARSGLTGGSVAQGGWAVSLERFNRLTIAQGYADAGAAVTLLTLRDAAAPTGQFYAPDPTEITASVGGTIATNASGSRSFRYGSTRRHIESVRAIFADGRVATFRRGDGIDFPVSPVPWPATTKCTAGYPLQPGMDYIDLLCGSEGTLGIITEARVKLLPIPAHLFAAVVFFAADEDALNAVDAWRPVAGLRMLEYVDRNSLELIEPRFPEIPARARATLLIEAEGEPDLDAWSDRLEATNALADDSWFATSASDRERFRRFRHALPEMVNATVLQRGFMKMGTDYAVPIEKSREILAYYRERLEAELPGRYVIYGHIGDAHAHVNMLPADDREASIAGGFLKEFAAKAVSLGGTVSAEHGLGKRKAKLLALQYQPEHIAAMVEVKTRLDPHWLLGRGTLLPVPAGL
ncbi:MAG: FAD-binding oxidoreductase [Bryobacteraceae bacterium]|nr:FAD-binding oxidoreductase [Bryobacteraceae bacterium]